MTSFKVNAENNLCDIGDKCVLSGSVTGENNKVVIRNASGLCNIDLIIRGDNNDVFIDCPGSIRHLVIRIGNHVHANKTKLKIDAGFSNEGGGLFLLYNSGNQLHIGKNCMFSKNITVRCGDSPHLLFDRNSGKYLDVSDGVFIGDHVWLGEDVYITKKCTIPSDCIVGARSVVTKRFQERFCAIAGNPAKVVRTNVEWVRNSTQLSSDSSYKISYDDHVNSFN